MISQILYDYYKGDKLKVNNSPDGNFNRSNPCIFNRETILYRDQLHCPQVDLHGLANNEEDFVIGGKETKVWCTFQQKFVFISIQFIVLRKF